MYEHYFDNAATTKVREEAIEAANYAMHTCYGNASSLHRAGMDAENLITQARRKAAKALHCLVDEVYFTSGATESNNLAISGAVRRSRGKAVVTTQIEHPAVKNPIDHLEAKGYTIKRIPIGEDGKFHPEDFANAVDEDTALVSCMWVNNETGLILPVEQIAAAVKLKNPNVFVHVDGVQGFCKLKMPSLKQIDFFSFSGHKIYAPKGIGGFYLRKSVSIQPLVLGGGHEKGLRSGTESVPLISALGMAIELTDSDKEKNLEKYRKMQINLSEKLSEIPGVILHKKWECAPYILNFSVPDVRSEILLHHLESYGFYVSSGSACSKGLPSEVLPSLGVTKKQADSVLRVSFGIYNSVEEIAPFVEALKEGLQRYGKRSHSNKGRGNRP